MPDVLSRTKATIGTFRIIIEEHQEGWDVALIESGATKGIEVGTLTTYEEAQKAGTDKARELFSKDSEFPKMITWTTARAVLPPERPTPPEQPWKSFASIALPLALGLTASVLAAVFSRTTKDISVISRAQEMDISKVTAALARTQRDIDEMKETITNAGPNIKPETEVANLRAEVDRLKEHFASFEIVLGDNLDRRIAVPLLRKDLDSIKEQYKFDLAGIDARLNLIVDLMKWFLGLIGLGGLLSGLSNWFSKPKLPTESVAKA